ncbi:MAG: UDP-N-acetylmuramoyl-tripeptide--D-alanyl-D-alanine ligase [Clostridiales bacterium]|jgi:UDP-N-acetylmuramoyl-tripeptide--D-alanyl-D-alanine ligase|nr:UDP-N-acetylmuramoyl-tripeptide--D-alanyl-D-alanine ligase [Clostridiales bacterium]
MVFLAAALFIHALLLGLYGKRPLHILQSDNYRAGEYFGRVWRERRRFIPECALSVGGAAVFILFYLLLPNRPTEFYLLGLLPYMLGAVKLTVKTQLAKPKKPIVFTARLKRLYGLYCALVLLPHAAGILILNFSLLNSQFSIILAALPLSPLLAHPLAALAALLAAPIENKINRRYIEAARRKLNAMPDLVRIGVAGSFGKTGVKNYLAAMLGQKYRVCASPASFNTPLGLAKTVNERLKEGDEILIAEMGARRVGDIRALCAWIRPQYGLLNTVGNQHLATFKTEENILRAKYELIEGLVPPARAVFNCDGEKTAALYEWYAGKKLASGQCETRSADCGMRSAEREIKGTDFDMCYSDAAVTPSGSAFTLNCGTESVRCTTRLLGEHTIGNLTVAATLAHELGVPLRAIAETIRDMEPIPHRLELIRPGNGVTVIDDAYNSNPQGFRAAARVLSVFTGGRRILITPGFAELGRQTAAENRRAGETAAACADFLLALGRGGRALRDGWLAGGGAENRVFALPDLDAAKEWLAGNVKAGDTVLFENDIPDF